MSVSAMQASAFYPEALANGRVWSIRDEEGFPAPLNQDGVRVMPFWSRASRAQRIIDGVVAFRSFYPFEIDLRTFEGRWLRGIARDGHLVGLNWAGARATGFDFTPKDVRQGLRSAGFEVTGIDEKARRIIGLF